MLSIQAELLPSTRALVSPQEVVTSLLQKPTDYKTDLGKSHAEAALQTTTSVIATMRSGGADDKDELLLLMVARERKQLLEVTRLTDKAPSQEMRRETLSSIRQNFVKQLQSQADGRASGAAKAAERAAERRQQASERLAAAQLMMGSVELTKYQLDNAHTQRGEHKRMQRVEVLELFDEKLTELEAEDVDFLGAEGEEDDPVRNETETDRD